MKETTVTFDPNKTRYQIVEGKFNEQNKSVARFEGEEITVSDGYHTMDELYEHRIELFIAICRIHVREAQFGDMKISDGYPVVWRSQLHANGSGYEGWFILGIGKEDGKQITYHLPSTKWDEVSFAETLERAPEFDGHSSVEVLARLKKL